MATNSNIIQHNDDEVNPPDFLNKDFFEEILRKSENDVNLQVKKLEVLPGSNPGDHFGSVMFKAIASCISKEGKEISRSLIAKIAPIADGVKMDMIGGLPIFDREIEMYTKVLPQMKTICESIGDEEDLAPRLLYHSNNPQIVVLEDIRKYGYEMQYKFYDFNNTVKVLKKLAKFHALSFYMNDNKYVYRTDLTKYTTIMNEALFKNMKALFGGFDYLKDEVKNWPGFEKISEKLGTQTDTFVQKLVEVYHPMPEPGFNVICHGDFHLKNMMFIKDGDNIHKTMFLDFQTCFWGSPAVDLIYVLYGIGGTECRARRGEILLIYHQTLTDYLNRLGCLKKPPSLLDLNIEMLKRGTMELMWSVCFLQFYHLDFTKVRFEDILSTDPQVMAKMKKYVYTHEEIVKVLKKVLPELFFKGILE